MVRSKSSGFTLIELLVVIGIITILAAIVLVAVNPGRQFASARDTQRRSDLYAITNSIYQFAAEHNGRLPGTDDTVAVPNFPTTATCIGSTAPCWNLGAAGQVDGLNNGITEPIVPTYVAAVPVDPSIGTQANTNYIIRLDSATGRIIASATGELTATITVTR